MITIIKKDWFERWREVYDSNQKWLDELNDSDDSELKSMLANAEERKRLLLIALRKREAWEEVFGRKSES